MKIFGYVIMRHNDLLDRDAKHYESGKEQGIGDAKWLKAKNLELDAEIHKLLEEPIKLRVEMEGFKSKVRDQTEADLFMVSLKIILKSLIPTGTYDKYRESSMQDLQAQQMALRNQLGAMSQGVPIGGLWGIGAAMQNIWPWR